MKHTLISLALLIGWTVSAGAAEVLFEKGDVVIDPIQKNLRVRRVSLEPIAGRAAVRLSRHCPCPPGPCPIPPTPIDPPKPEIRGGDCDCPGCPTCPGCGSGLTVTLDMKDSGDRDVYETLMHATHGDVTLAMKGGKLVGVSVSDGGGCCPHPHPHPTPTPIPDPKP